MSRRIRKRTPVIERPCANGRPLGGHRGRRNECGSRVFGGRYAIDRLDDLLERVMKPKRYWPRSNETRRGVFAALATGRPNAIRRQVGDALGQLNYLLQHGQASAVSVPAPRNMIEQVALEIWTEAYEQQTGAPVEVASRH